MSEKHESCNQPPSIHFTQGSLVEPESIEWIWDQHIARRKLHLIAGEPGTNKTTLTMALAATITIGGRWPDGSYYKTPQNVVIWSSEDGFEDTLLPRFIANGGNREKIFFVNGVKQNGKSKPFNPKKDLSILTSSIKALGNVGMVIVDSIADCTNGDSHKNSDTRNSLQPLVNAANEYDFALVGVVHFNKGNESTNPLNRIVGSIGFGGMARIVFASAFDPDEPITHRRFVRIKNNIGMNHGGFKYAIKIDSLPKYPHIQAAHIEWIEQLEGTAKELLGFDPLKDDEKPGSTKQNQARDFLIKILSEVDMLREEEIERQGLENHFPLVTLKRAKRAANVESIKHGKLWYWKLFTTENPTKY